MNAPETLEGVQAWWVLRASGGQLRTVGAVAVGFDASAVLALGAAVGACPVVLAEMLEAVEQIVVSKINERLRL